MEPISIGSGRQYASSGGGGGGGGVLRGTGEEGEVGNREGEQI